MSQTEKNQMEELMESVAGLSAELAQKKLRREAKVGAITTYTVNTIVWIIAGGIGLTALWGIIEVVKLILITLGLRG